MTTGLLDDAVVAFTDAWDSVEDPHLHVTGPHRTGRTHAHPPAPQLAAARRNGALARSTHA